jgi:hypothetical protein
VLLQTIDVQGYSFVSLKLNKKGEHIGSPLQTQLGVCNMRCVRVGIPRGHTRKYGHEKNTNAKQSEWIPLPSGEILRIAPSRFELLTL